MEFKKYTHIERFGSSEVNGIEYGDCYIFDKLDGTNGSVWLNRGDGTIRAGSRNRELSIDDDNAGFLASVLEDEAIAKFLKDNPGKRLYGEWLVPHTFKKYQEGAWRKFYVFDVAEEYEDKRKPVYKDEGGEEFILGTSERYMAFPEYKELLEEAGVEYICPFAVIKNGNIETFINQLPSATMLVQDGEGSGEGIVIKNYAYTNRFGRTAFAKIVRTEFKQLNMKKFGPSEKNGIKMVESDIAEKYVTKTLVDKEFAKIVNDSEHGWESKMLPKLLGIVFYCLVKEETANFVKEFKNPTIDFKRLQSLTNIQVKTLLPELF